MSVIKRRRGNTYADEVIVKSETTRAIIPVTGCTFEMHVTTDRAPSTRVPYNVLTPGSNLLFTITGAIVDGPGGRVEFAPSAPQADQEDGNYFYEVIMTDAAGRTRTVALDSYIFW